MSRKLREILSTSLYFLVVLLAVYMVVTYVGQRTMVIGTSMEPMLNDGDNLIARKDMISLYFRSAMRKRLIISSGLLGCQGKRSLLMRKEQYLSMGSLLRSSTGKRRLLIREGLMSR